MLAGFVRNASYVPPGKANMPLLVLESRIFPLPDTCPRLWNVELRASSTPLITTDAAFAPLEFSAMESTDRITTGFPLGTVDVFHTVASFQFPDLILVIVAKEAN